MPTRASPLHCVGKQNFTFPLSLVKATIFFPLKECYLLQYLVRKSDFFYDMYSETVRERLLKKERTGEREAERERMRERVQDREQDIGTET